ncbi:hypothetical protein SAMN05444671_2476 [Flavobacterium sp. CF108]|uniref:DUF434 domain-containing protein n=1 Tax=unclassified Flavobacterium TaxID=196869 RepID=UPI0008C2CA1C|nr:MULTISPECIES: DUF434 domain-containing protein [unclassified Flavobacterium]SEN93224.1 hypothetical protein SAMN04487978_1792 [Flavobacterium sp. fv08]SHH27570.1 hypothetical protein SAMN05444671_2476 [Flavobacterium sp. CF108]
MTNLKNRGKEASDDVLFGTLKIQLKLKEAVADMRYFLSRGYGEKATLALVGNRYRLNSRQQQVVRGMSASQNQIEDRKSKEIEIQNLAGKEIIIDGFNALILLESILSNAYVFKGLDGFIRDLSSVYGTYKKVKQTSQAIEIIADFFVKQQIKKAYWLFDKPVSNSGKLKQIIEEIASINNYNWTVELVNNPDKIIAERNLIAITSDAWILDNCSANFNLIKHILEDLNVHETIIYSE